MRLTFLAGLLALALAAAAPARADEWSKKYSVTGKPELRITTNDGSIDIYSSDSKEIDARVTTDRWRIPRDVRISESQSGDHVTIDISAPRSHWNWFGSSSSSLRIELHVPRAIDLEAHSGDGHISSQALSGRIHLDSGDGHIHTDGLSGDVRLHTGDGHIEGSNFDGALDADTGDGHITIRGRFDALRLKTGDGSIEAEAGNGSKLSSSWSITTGDGNISLRLPVSVSADLDAHSGDGRISLDFPVTVSGTLSGSTIRGKIGGGGSLLTIRTGDGSIRIEKI